MSKEYEKPLLAHSEVNLYALLFTVKSKYKNMSSTLYYFIYSVYEHDKRRLLNIQTSPGEWPEHANGVLVNSSKL